MITQRKYKVLIALRNLVHCLGEVILTELCHSNDPLERGKVLHGY